MSKPENFPACSRLRLYHDSHSGWAGLGFTPVVNLFAQKMRDDTGRQVIVILNKQERTSCKDCPGDIAYYLFDEDGKFVRGGIYAMAEGFEGDVVNARVDYDRHISVAVGWGASASNPDNVHFVLKQSDLVLQGSTTSHGTFKNAEATRAVSSNDDSGGLGLSSTASPASRQRPSRWSFFNLFLRRFAVMRLNVPLRLAFFKKISESGESGVWDTDNRFGGTDSRYILAHCLTLRGGEGGDRDVPL